MTGRVASQLPGSLEARGEARPLWELWRRQGQRMTRPPVRAPLRPSWRTVVDRGLESDLRTRFFSPLAFPQTDGHT